MIKYTEAVLEGFLLHINLKTTARYYNGRFYSGWADASKTKYGVKYNRLLRLRRGVYKWT